VLVSLRPGVPGAGGAPLSVRDRLALPILEQRLDHHALPITLVTFCDAVGECNGIPAYR